MHHRGLQTARPSTPNGVTHARRAHPPSVPLLTWPSLMGTIGVCEDDPSLRRLLSRALEGGGHDVLLAHNGAEALRVFAVDRGDDYVTKPFEIKEVLARLSVLVRRAPRTGTGPSGVTLDPARHSVRSSIGEVALTPTEYRVLAAIASRPGEVVRRRTVVAAAWSESAYVSGNSLDTFMRRVRNKLEQIHAPVQVETVRGVGYRLR